MARDVTWTVSGTIMVFDNLTGWKFRNDRAGPRYSAGIHGPNHNQPLRNIEVRIQGSTLKKGGFRTWQTVRTNTRGAVSLRTRRPGTPHRLRVRIRFNDDDLAVLDPRGADQMRTRWITIFEDLNRRRPTTRPLGNLVFDSRSRHRELGKTQNHVQAIFWFAAGTLIRRLKRADPWLAFRGKVHVTWPARLVSGASFAQNILANRTAHIHRRVSDGHKILTLFHEMMHLWNYDHNKGTTNWLSGIISFRHGADLATDGHQEHPTIAFHEGFAEYAAWELWHALFGIVRTTPYSRAHLKQNLDLVSLTQVERNWLGVMTGLQLLSDPDVYRYRFGSGDGVPQTWVQDGPKPHGCPPPPAMKIWQVLKLFEANPRSGWPTDWQVGHRSYGLRRFYDRPEDISPSFDGATKRLFLDLIDPASEREPQSRCRAR